MPDPLATISTRRTAQSEQADTRQVPNSVDGGTYYASEQKIAKDNAAVILQWATERSTELVREVVTISTAGRAPRNNPAIFALAAASALGDTEGRKAAL